MLLFECLASVRNVLRKRCLRFQVLELLSVIQMKEQVLLVGSQLQFTFFAPYNMSVLKTVGEIIDKNILQDTRFAVFFLHVDVIAVNFGIENTFRNIHFGRFLLH